MRERGVSDVIGFVLVFSLVAGTVAVVSLSGFTALEDVREAEKIDNAERAFDVLADNVEDVHQGGVPSRATEVSLAEAQLGTASTITVNVTARNTTTSDNFTVSRAVDPIVWRDPANEDARLVYALGGVLRTNREGGVVVREPPLRFESDRSILPLLETFTDQPRVFGGSTIRVRASRTTSSVIAVEDPPDFDELWLNITSPRADTWHQYLDRQPGTDCSLVSLPGDDQVTCELGTDDGFYITVTKIEVDIEG